MFLYTAIMRDTRTWCRSTWKSKRH